MTSWHRENRPPGLASIKTARGEQAAAELGGDWPWGTWLWGLSGWKRVTAQGLSRRKWEKCADGVNRNPSSADPEEATGPRHLIHLSTNCPEWSASVGSHFHEAPGTKGHISRRYEGPQQHSDASVALCLCIVRPANP